MYEPAQTCASDDVLLGLLKSCSQPAGIDVHLLDMQHAPQLYL
jgi:hypothetical protein